MAEITPSLPDRTYLKDYAASDTESEGEAQVEVDTEDEAQYSIATRLVQNQEYMDQQIASSSARILEHQAWKTTEGADVFLIRKPTASNLSHRLLNPFIYRNIHDVGTLNDLATILDTPDDWEERYNQVVADGDIIRDMDEFRSLPDDTAKSDIQWQFVGLISAIARASVSAFVQNQKPKSLWAAFWQDTNMTSAAKRPRISSISAD